MKPGNKVLADSKATMQATVTTAILEPSASLPEKPSAARGSLSVEIVRQPKGNSLALLVRQIHPSQRWEDAVWIALALASLALVVMSFHR